MSTSKGLHKFFLLLKQAFLGSEGQDYTSGSINRAIFLLSIPMILEMGMESLFALVDAFFVSRLNDTDALATVGLTESVLTLIYSLAMGLSMGATAIVARRVGEKNIDGAQRAALQVIYIGVTLSVLISIVGIFYSEEILRLMGASESLIRAHAGYARWMIVGNITIMLIFLINGIFRGAGDASIAMRALILSNVLNMILDPLFIFGFGPIPAFGVEGAAIATNIGRGIGVLFQLYLLFRGKSIIKLAFRVAPLDWPLIGKIIRISAGGTGQFLIASASWIFLVRILSDFGSNAVAGYTLAIRLIVFAILPAWGMANAAATLVGQNLGAGQPDRAERSVWRSAFLNMVFLGMVTVLFFTLAEHILLFFTTDAQVLTNAVQCLQIVSLGYIFYAYGMVISQSFNGAGDTKTPTIISFVGFWLFQIPLAYVLAKVFHTGPAGVFAAIAIAESMMAVVSILIFRRGNWKTVQV